MNKFFATILIPPLLPLLVAQGYWARRRTPRLPDASGPLSGTAGGYGKQVELVVLGESTVAGMGASTHEYALTGQTALALAGLTKRPVHWHAIGRSGITARESLSELVPKLSGTTADLVIIALGVNDAIALHTSSRWSSDIEMLIKGVRRQFNDATKEHAGEPHIVLAGVPRLERFPALPFPLSFVLGVRSTSLDLASAKLASRLTRVLHVPFLVEKDPQLFCVDGFHPSELGYQSWGRQLASAIGPHLGDGVEAKQTTEGRD